MKKSMIFPRMTRLLVALMISGSLTVVSFAQKPKVATVNMTTLLNEFYKTKDAEKEDQLLRESIRNEDNTRMTAIQALVEELRKLEREFSDPSLAEEKRKSIARVAQDRQRELAGLQEERKEFIERRRKALNQKMVGLMDEIRGKVAAAVAEYSASQNVDFVFDESGLTSSQVPFLLYVREKVDLTDAVLAALNKDAPQTEEAPATEPKE